MIAIANLYQRWKNRKSIKTLESWKREVPSHADEVQLIFPVGIIPCLRDDLKKEKADEAQSKEGLGRLNKETSPATVNATPKDPDWQEIEDLINKYGTRENQAEWRYILMRLEDA